MTRFNPQLAVDLSSLAQPADDRPDVTGFVGPGVDTPSAVPASETADEATVEPWTNERITAILMALLFMFEHERHPAWMHALDEMAMELLDGLTAVTGVDASRPATDGFGSSGLGQPSSTTAEPATAGGV
jgi:hypothetical protein